jgi:hypothetical protein
VISYEHCTCWGHAVASVPLPPPAPETWQPQPHPTTGTPRGFPLLTVYGPPVPSQWQILDRSDHLGPWYLVRDRNYAGYSPIHVNNLETALKVWHRRSVA